MAQVIKLKRGLKARLEATLIGANKPKRGEPIWEIDTNKLKIGDGINDYVDLPYVQGDTHSHANKSELDLIQSGDVAKWNAKQNAISVDTGLTFNNNIIGLDLESVIIDCGDASDWAPEPNANSN